jgi:hypothetical protein
MAEIETLTQEEREELEYEAKDIEMVGSTETDFSTGIRKALRIIDQQAARIGDLNARIERLRGVLGLVVASDSHALAKALAAEMLRQSDAKP